MSSETSDFDIYLSVNKRISDLNIKIDFSHDFNRKQITNSTLIETLIENEWNKRIQKSCLLFNASKFRLHSFIFSNDVLTLNIGLTNYKDFIATHQCSHIVDAIRNELNNNSSIHDYLARPLGCSSILLTSDDKFLLIRRSSTCAEYPLYYDVPGGYAEPGVCGIENNDKIKDELLFESIVRELKEELNFDKEFYDLNENVLLGLIFNKEKFDKPNIQFLIRSKLDSIQMKQLYIDNKHEDANETCGVLFISIEEMRQHYIDNTTELWTHLTPSAKSSFTIYFREST